MKRKIIIIIIIVALLLSIIGILLKQSKNEETKLMEIKVNEVTRSVFYAPQYVAINKGYFKDAGMNIELTTGQGADSVMTAVLANQCDIGFARTRSINICIQ